MSILIKNAQLANGQLVNIFIKDQLINSINFKKPLADKKIDAKGKLVIPGIIDPHVHFRVPGASYKEDWETGSLAAASCGITCVLDMPNNNPAITSQEKLDQKYQLIRGKSYVNYGLYIGATESNLSKLKNIQRAVGIKIYLGSSTGGLLVTNYKKVEEILSNCNQLVVFHSEGESCIKKSQEVIDNNQKNIAKFHDQLRPEECALQSTKKIINIVKKTKKPVYICHVSTSKEIKIIAKAKAKGLPIFAEATPHHLFFNKEIVAELGNFAKVNPPLRTKESQQSLQKALSSGIINAIGTDHAPHTREEKLMPYQKAPAGLPGLETALSVMLDLFFQNKITLKRIVELMCWNPADIFKIKKRGKLEPGYFADVVLIDLDLTASLKNSKLYTKCGWSPYSKFNLKHFPALVTIINGQIVFYQGKFSANPAGKAII